MTQRTSMTAAEGRCAGEARRPFPINLFCFASAGASAAPYRKWIQLLPRHIVVTPVELPGRGTRWNEALRNDFRAAVRDLLPSLAEAARRPGAGVAFFGHSLGAFFCYEAARCLWAAGLPLPRHLFLSAARAPHIARREGPLSTLGDAEFLEHIARLDGTPREILSDASAMELYLPVLRADARLYDSVPCARPAERLPIPISVFGGAHDPEVCEGDLEAWRDYTSSEFRVEVWPGGHFYYRSALDRLMHRIAEALGK